MQQNVQLNSRLFSVSLFVTVRSSRENAVFREILVRIRSARPREFEMVILYRGGTVGEKKKKRILRLALKLNRSINRTVIVMYV